MWKCQGLVILNTTVSSSHHKMAIQCKYTDANKHSTAKKKPDNRVMMCNFTWLIFFSGIDSKYPWRFIALMGRTPLTGSVLPWLKCKMEHPLHWYSSAISPIIIKGGSKVYRPALPRRGTVHGLHSAKDDFFVIQVPQLLINGMTEIKETYTGHPQ